MYQPIKPSKSFSIALRGLNYHVRVWGDDGDPPLIFLHGGRDASATFQFMVDALQENWRILAPDWRGHGQSDWAPGGYWLQDYMADLDALLEAFSPGEPATIVAHSLGANVSEPYAGTRPERVRRLVVLDGFGLANEKPEDTPHHLARWLASQKTTSRARSFVSFAEMADKLQAANPRLERTKAEFLASQVSRKHADGGLTWAFDPRFRSPRAAVYRFDEWAACFRNVQAPVLALSAGLHVKRLVPLDQVAQRVALFPKAARIHIRDVGHNMQHEAPAFVARAIEPFLVTGELPASIEVEAHR
jgi:pimeloyl-ACP methyl ester carboxylesterase